MIDISRGFYYRNAAVFEKYEDILFFKAGQLGYMKFALNQLIVGVLNGVCGRLQVMYCGYCNYFFGKMIAVTLMKYLILKFFPNFLASFDFDMVDLVATLK